MTRGLAALSLCVISGCSHGPYLIGDDSPSSDAEVPPSALGNERCALAGASGGLRYFTCSHARTWSDAEATCALAAGTLATIADAALESLLAANVTGEAWIGFYAPTGTRVFQWVDGTPPSYQAFRPAEPDNLGGDEPCVALAAGDDAGAPGWDDRDCIVDLPFICAVPR